MSDADKPLGSCRAPGRGCASPEAALQARQGTVWATGLLSSKHPQRATRQILRAGWQGPPSPPAPSAAWGPPHGRTACHSRSHAGWRRVHNEASVRDDTAERLSGDTRPANQSAFTPVFPDTCPADGRRVAQHRLTCRKLPATPRPATRQVLDVGPRPGQTGRLGGAPSLVADHVGLRSSSGERRAGPRKLPWAATETGEPSPARPCKGHPHGVPEGPASGHRTNSKVTT